MLTKAEIESIKSTFRYNEETGALYRIKSRHKRYIGWTFGTKNGRGYMLVRIGKKKYPVHRVAWILYYGYEPIEVDHINHNKDDNRLSNLREVDRSTQMKNRRKNSNNSTGVNGVSIDNGRYKVYTNVGGKRVHLGIYKTLKEASAARESADRLNGYHINHGDKK